MIISASRRTDIPAFYSDWFINRLKEGFVLVRNPLNIHQVSRINLSNDVVDCIVFWTKNPEPMLDKLDYLQEYNYYFQFTLTSYQVDVEKKVPSKGKQIISTFKKLSDLIGPEKVIWRYDPILLNKKYTIEYHLKNYEKLAKVLSGYTDKCIISFLDFYSKTTKNLKDLDVENFDYEKIIIIAKKIAEIAKKYNLKIETCAEKYELENFGIKHAHCIDSELIEKIVNCKLNLKKDKNQRVECGCVQSVDIGAYNTCQNGCKYCYANYNFETVNKNCSNYHKESAILCDKINPNLDRIVERKVESLKIRQSKFNFD